MARDTKTENSEVNTGSPAEGSAPTENTAAATAPSTAPAAVPEAKGDDRFIILSVPDTEGNTHQVKRKEFILALWQGTVTPYNPDGTKFSRGDIARKLTTLQGKTVPYQIVFGATKDIPGGPAAPAKPEAAPTPTPTPESTPTA